MIKIENIVTPSPEQWKSIILATRNPMNSWDKSDSGYCGECYPWEQTCEFVIGKNDLTLMKKLAKAGTDHRKFVRMIVVYVDITAPLYWWKEFDTYKVGTVANSCSTMHRLTYKPFEVSDFSFEHLTGNESKEYFDVECEFEEVFRDIPEHENYAISNKGRVWSKKRDKFLTLSVNSSNYKKVVLDGKNYYVHKLVAKVFCSNPDELEEVNHIDGDTTNNVFTNLEWVTKKENMQHAI